MNFSGDWRETPELRYHAEKYLTHEVLHLWNGWVRQSGKQTPAWLTEGYAEFFALEVMRSRGSITGTQLQNEILERSMQCLNAEHSAGGTDFAERQIEGESIYDCGVMAIYQLDRHLGSASLLEAAAPWRDVFSNASAGEITLKEVLRRYSAQARKRRPFSIHGKTKPFETPSFSRIGLEEIGIESSADTSSNRYANDVREQFLQSLVQQFCMSPPFGFTTFPEYAELDTDARCGVLSGNPKIAGVAGQSLFGSDVVHVVQNSVSICNAKKEFLLNVHNGKDIPIRCETSMSLAQPRQTLSCRAHEACDITERTEDE